MNNHIIWNIVGYLAVGEPLHYMQLVWRKFPRVDFKIIKYEIVRAVNRLKD